MHARVMGDAPSQGQPALGIRHGHGVESGACKFWEPVISDVSELGAGLDSCFHLLFIEHTLLKQLQGAGCYSKYVTNTDFFNPHSNSRVRHTIIIPIS